MRFRGALAIGLSVVAVGACSSPTPEVSRESLEHQLFDKLTAALGYKPQSVTCPGGLTAVKGTKQTCTMKNDGVDYHVVVTASEVKGDKVSFDVSMSGEPVQEPGKPIDGPMIGKAELVDAVTEFAQSQDGKAPDRVVCPEDLPVKLDASVTCYLHEGRDVFDVSVRATKVEGVDVEFEIGISAKPR
ncbi:DUF4333 domain-containing protein [Smaragdicoccus niigatensis]|uniref:DUF4333 domain-containing protein n=1 Tax=Smaragdicoccus niigatensis TaxID=359359 RepID=UPI000362E72F|nr:DUF4333 domain-containing protein [Smaragdicoccus niigatensis]